MSIGQNIKKYRKEKKITQKELATLVGVNEVTIRSYEAEKYRPKIETLKKIADALNISIAELEPTLFQNSHCQNGVITNFEKLGYSQDESVDEVAVGMLIERIRDDVDKDRFYMAFQQYIRLYKAVKDWLNSEVKE